MKVLCIIAIGLIFLNAVLILYKFRWFLFEIIKGLFSVVSLLVTSYFIGILTIYMFKKWKGSSENDK